MRRLAAVDGLRALAALLVVLSHLPNLSGPLVFLRPAQEMGHTGVGLFLVLSGFSIHYRWATTREYGEFAQRPFWRRRFMRLYPTYLAAVVVAAACYVVANRVFSTPEVSGWYFGDGPLPLWLALASQFLLVTANVVNTPYVIVDWSLALEFQLYAAYAAVARRIQAIGPMRLVIGALAIGLLWRLGAQYVTESVPIGQSVPGSDFTFKSVAMYSQLPARLFEWMLGMLAAEIVAGNRSIPSWSRRFEVPAAMLIVAYLVQANEVGTADLGDHSFYLSDVLLDPFIGVAYFTLLLWTVKPTTFKSLRAVVERLAPIGLFSYSLYLVHVPIIDLVGRAAPNGAPLWVTVVAQAVASILFARLFFVVVERRFLIPSRRPVRELAETPENPAKRR